MKQQCPVGQDGITWRPQANKTEEKQEALISLSFNNMSPATEYTTFPWQKLYMSRYNSIRRKIPQYKGRQSHKQSIYIIGWGVENNQRNMKIYIKGARNQRHKITIIYLFFFPFMASF